MLHLETVEPRAFSLLKNLMDLQDFKDFALVGGTAISLKFGHRKSDDLDLFTTDPFDNADLEKSLQKSFQDKFLNRTTNPKFGIFCFIDDTKLDFIHHPHPLIRPYLEIEGLRFFSTEDIIAMKVQAVLGRAMKKDFWDIAELLQHYSVADFIQFHKEKYATQNLLISVPQAITYFADAEESQDPVSLKGQSWQSVKKFIQKKVRDYIG